MTRPRGIVPHGLLTQPVPLPWEVLGSEGSEGANQVLPVGLRSTGSWVPL